MQLLAGTMLQCSASPQANDLSGWQPNSCRATPILQGLYGKRLHLDSLAESRRLYCRKVLLSPCGVQRGSTVPSCSFGCHPHCPGVVSLSVRPSVRPYVLPSIRPSVRPSVCLWTSVTSVRPLFDLRSTSLRFLFDLLSTFNSQYITLV